MQQQNMIRTIARKLKHPNFDNSSNDVFFWLLCQNKENYNVLLFKSFNLKLTTTHNCKYVYFFCHLQFVKNKT